MRGVPDEVDVRGEGRGVERGFDVGVGLTTPPFSCVSELIPAALFTLKKGECSNSKARMINKINIKQALKGLSFILVVKHTRRLLNQLCHYHVHPRVGQNSKGYYRSTAARRNPI